MEFEAVVKYSEYASAVKDGEQISVEMQGLVLDSDDDFVAKEEISLIAPSIYIVVRRAKSYSTIFCNYGTSFAQPEETITCWKFGGRTFRDLEIETEGLSQIAR